jgi:hypothetical protein
MDLLGKTLAALANYGVKFIGQPTHVNGVKFPDGANWTEAQPNRITTYLDQNEWGKTAYDVVFPASVLAGDWKLSEGSELLRVLTGQRCLVRRIDIPGIGNTNIDVMALVVVAG